MPLHHGLSAVQDFQFALTSWLSGLLLTCVWYHIQFWETGLQADAPSQTPAAIIYTLLPLSWGSWVVNLVLLGLGPCVTLQHLGLCVMSLCTLLHMQDHWVKAKNCLTLSDVRSFNILTNLITMYLPCTGDETLKKGIFQTWQLTLYGSSWTPEDVEERRRWKKLQ